jgi:hypothetical protein
LDSIAFVCDNSKDSPSWEERFKQLEALHALHGHSLVTMKYDLKEAPRLCAWMRSQRCLKQNENKTTAGRAGVALKKAGLDSLGFFWGNSKVSVSPSWEERFKQLEAFHELHGHCRVTAQYDREQAPGLCGWTGNQRSILQKEKKTEAAKARKAELDLLGFVWGASSDAPGWEGRFKQLKAFHALPSNDEIRSRENSWIVRVGDKPAKLLAERMENRGCDGEES